MTKKRFLSIILTVLMVLSIVHATPAHANQLETAPSVGVVQRSIPVYTNRGDTIAAYTLGPGESFTVINSVIDSLVAHYYYISYNTSTNKDGINGYIKERDLYTNAIVIYGSPATVKWNVSVYYGPNSQYQRCGTLYTGETVAVLEKSDTYSYVEYNDNVHGRRKRAYADTNALTFTCNMPSKTLAIADINNGFKCYVGLKYTVYSGPSTQYEPVGSVSDMHIYWVKRYTENDKSKIDEPFYGMTYIKYQVTGTNTWKSGDIVFNYPEVRECVPNCQHW